MCESLREKIHQRKEGGYRASHLLEERYQPKLPTPLDRGQHAHHLVLRCCRFHEEILCTRIPDRMLGHRKLATQGRLRNP